jgi:hypothetical protein
MKPTPDSVKAYVDAVVAWSEGKKVEQRHNATGVMPHKRDWYPFDGEAYIDGAEYRVVPDPPKAREFWLNVYQDGSVGVLRESRKAADDHATGKRTDCIRIREILPTEIVVDKAEYEELRRNEAELKAAIKECSNQRKRSLLLYFYHTDLQSSLAEKDETIAELRARCEAAELDASRYGFLADGTDERFDVTYWIDNEHQELFCDRERLSEVIDDAIAAQHAQRKKEGK